MPVAEQVKGAYTQSLPRVDLPAPEGVRIVPIPGRGVVEQAQGKAAVVGVGGLGVPESLTSVHPLKDTINVNLKKESLITSEDAPRAERVGKRREHFGSKTANTIESHSVQGEYKE